MDNHTSLSGEYYSWKDRVEERERENELKYISSRLVIATLFESLILASTLKLFS